MSQCVTGACGVLAAAVCSWACAGAPLGGAGAQDGAASIGREARATELFAAHCAVCHGARGAGDGPAYPWLFPPARDFTSGRFRLASTEGGVPSDEDLVRTLRRGLPGSAMPAWNWLPQRDLEDLAWFVREAAVAGLARRLRAEAMAQGDGFAVRSASREARERMQPGSALAPLSAIPQDGAALELGRELYVLNCAGCHGLDGSGDDLPRLDEDGRLNWARDFTAGFLKGGASPTELSWRIRTGLPGTAMPAFSFEGEELEALVAFVNALIPAGSETRLVHARGTLRAERVRELPAGPEDPRWDACEWLGLVLSPLHWNEEAVLGADLAAVHDGRRMALAVRWNDASGEQRVFSDPFGPDAVALQFSTAEWPTLFGMGSAQHPTTIWHWKALRVADVAGMLELVEAVPHRVGEPFPGQARDVGLVYDRQVSIGVDRLEVAGVGTPLALQAGEEIEVAPRWFDGQWTVVFTRELAPSGDPGGTRQVALVPGGTVQFAVAVWNGAAGDRRAQKSISIWHALALER